MLAHSPEENRTTWCETWQSVAHSVAVGDVVQLAHISANQNAENSGKKHKWSVALKVSSDMLLWPYLPARPRVQMMLQPPQTASPAGKLWDTTHIRTIGETRTKRVHEAETCGGPMKMKRVCQPSS